MQHLPQHCSGNCKRILVSEPIEPARSKIRPSNSTCNRLILLLDESGSMSSQRDDIIGGINEMIRQQRQVEPNRNHEIHFDIIKFSGHVEPCRSETLQSIKEFTTWDYSPSGSTALFDAIGSCINKYRNERNVVMVIATDGQENASREYKYTDITRMIENQREKQNWHMVYLSEDIDTFQQGDSIGITNFAKQSYNQSVGKECLGKAFATQAYNKNISLCRMGLQADFSEVKVKDDQIPSTLSYRPSQPSTLSYRPSSSTTSGTSGYVFPPLNRSRWS